MRVPEFDPVILAFGPLAIRWYSLAYIFGILFTLLWLKRCNKKTPLLSEAAYDSWLTWAVLSIILGGRIGYVIFYNFSYFLTNPLEIFAFWHGGMSFHGGLLGSILGMWLFCRKHKVNFLRLTDMLVVAAPVGIFFGRIANFINLELYGRVTDSRFGMIFPGAGDLPRHPSQLYEAGLEGILTFLIMICLYSFTSAPKTPGRLSGIFLMLYGSFRIFIENFRQPDEQIGFLFNYLTLGQILSIPLIILGIFVSLSAGKTNRNH